MKKFITLLAIAFFMPNYALSAAAEASATDDATPIRACYARKLEEARRELGAISAAVRSMGLPNRVDLFAFSEKIPGIPMPVLTYRFLGYIDGIYIDMKPGIVFVGPRCYSFDPLSGLMTGAIGHTETIFKGVQVFAFLENKLDFIKKARSRAARYSTIIEINGVQFDFSPGVLKVNNIFYSIKDGSIYAKNNPRKRKVTVYDPPLRIEPFIGNMARIHGVTEDAIPSINVWHTNDSRERFSPHTTAVTDSETARATGLMLYESEAVPSLEDVERSTVRDIIIKGLKVGEICCTDGICPVAINHEGRLLKAGILRRAGIDPSGILTD
tara:strand:- start:6517 stop:7497 length:981 start_codon:yes stop_codon:yes gene_type:complete